MKQKQHDFGSGGDASPDQKTTKDDQILADAAAKGRGLLEKIKAATKKRTGRYVVDCCGVRTWVED